MGPIPNGSEEAVVTTVTRTSTCKKTSTGPSALQSRKASSRIPKRSTNFNRLFIQLSLIALVQSIEYVDTLFLGKCSVRVGMLVAKRNNSRFAFDIIDERSHRDLDAEGMLLIALQQNGIALVEVDNSIINAEPMATNCMRIWTRRGPISDGTKTLVSQALNERGILSIRNLGQMIGLRDPMASVCRLMCEGTVEIDLTQQLDRNSLVKLVAGTVNPPQAGSFQ